MTILPAPFQLLDLAEAMRPGWDRDELSQALDAAKLAGWSWPRTFLTVARLLCHEKAIPHDLAVAARSPFAKQAGDEPSTEYQQIKAAALEPEGGDR